jgi:hypothetical protein
MKDDVTDNMFKESVVSLRVCISLLRNVSWCAYAARVGSSCAACNAVFMHTAGGLRKRSFLTHKNRLFNPEPLQKIAANIS